MNEVYMRMALQQAEQAYNTMYRDCTDRVVYLQFVETNNRKDNQPRC